MSKMTELASGAIAAVDTVTNRARRGRRNPSDRHRQMACQGNRRSPAPPPSGADPAARVFAAAVVKLAQSLDGSNGCEPEH
jgi:hypothetical protein